MNVNAILICARKDLVTLRDPVATSLKTSFQEWTPLRIATGNSHLHAWVWSSIFMHHEKSPKKGLISWCARKDLC